MLELRNVDGKYEVISSGAYIGTITLYDNPCHRANCYVQLDMDCLDRTISAALFYRLKEIAGRPLQAMVDSDDIRLAEFLTAGGFVCKRKCYEIEASAADYIGGIGSEQLNYCLTEDPAYYACCHIMYQNYLSLHKPINPWTADYAAFCAALPGKAVYSKCGNQIASLAFIVDNEIAYVVCTEKTCFLQFAKSLVSSMLMQYESIFFEADDCDWAAMTLKSLFVNQNDTSFDTYIYDGDCL